MLRRRTSPRAPLSEALRHFLDPGTTDIDTHPADADALAIFCRRRDEMTLRALWGEHRDEVLAEWIAEAPGTRPWAWWQLEAPEPRRRLGGIGTEKWVGLPAHAPVYAFGIPAAWTDEWETRYYSGRAVDIHGQPIGQEFRGHDFRGVAIDPDDPPRFESEAAYLDRHGLLAADERADLPAEAFEPELVLAGDDEDGA
jgi:hypothetical protein